MSATTIVIAVLKADADLAEAIGGAVFGVMAPQGQDRPYIIVRLVAENDTILLGGVGQFPEARVQVDCVADDPATADALAEQVKGVLQTVINRTVDNGESPPGVVGVAHILKVGGDFQDWSEDRGVFRRVTDYAVRWRHAGG